MEMDSRSEVSQEEHTYSTKIQGQPFEIRVGDGDFPERLRSRPQGFENMG